MKLFINIGHVFVETQVWREGRIYAAHLRRAHLRHMSVRTGGARADAWVAVAGEGAPDTRSTDAQLRHIDQVTAVRGPL